MGNGWTNDLSINARVDRHLEFWQAIDLLIGDNTLDGILGIALTGLIVGIAYAAVPGAVNTESIRRTLNQGICNGLLVQIGSLVGDLLWAVIGLTGAVILLEYDAITIALGLIGGAFLLNLARSALQSAFHGPSADSNAITVDALKTGITFGLANPAGIAFWSGIGAGTLSQSGQSGPAPLIALLVSFCLGAMIWGGFLVLLISYSRRFASGRVLRWIDALCAIALGWFGVRLLWTSLRRIWTIASPATRALLPT